MGTVAGRRRGSDTPTPPAAFASPQAAVPLSMLEVLTVASSGTRALPSPSTQTLCLRRPWISTLGIHRAPGVSTHQDATALGTKCVLCQPS